MAQPVMQTSFNAGEWAPALNARVDLAKYRSGAALLRNFFVDYRGGASTRMGTRYILQAYKSETAVRLIPFQASFEVSYMLEFGDFYIRFFNNGAPVLEAIKTITNISQDAICTVTTSTPHEYNVGDWVYISGVSGMTQVNGRYFIVNGTNIGANFFSISDLFGVQVNSTSYSAYTAGGIVQRVYTLSSPYPAADIGGLKYAQNVDFMVICHPNHAPYTLTFNSSANWELTQISFGTTVATPTGVSASTFVAGAHHFSYEVSAVDADGQESAVSTPVDISINGAAGTNNRVTITWTAVSGATSYNVYRAGWNDNAPMPAGSAYGLIANVPGTSMVDNFSVLSPSNPADYSLTPPIIKNPFVGAGVTSITVTNPSVYGTTPTVSIAASPSGGQATALAYLGVATLSPAGFSTGTWSVGENGANAARGVNAICATVNGFNQPTSFQPMTFPGSIRGAISGTAPGSITLTSASGDTCLVNVTWGVYTVVVTQQGSGYLVPPAVTFSAGAAAATAVLDDINAGNPTVPIFYQQRLVLAGPVGNPQRFNMSQPGSYYNFNESEPIQPDDAIEGTLVSGQLNTIKSMIQMSKGLIMLSDKQAWVISAPSGGGVTPIDISATGQAYNGSSDLPPIVVGYDVLYVQSKGSIVRDLTYNFYTDIYTGTDVTVVSSHLFYGHTIVSWAYAEEPFKVLWAVRDDGILLSLTFLKEQELVGWAHSDTQGFFKSVGSIVETVASGTVDALYVVIERTINGNMVKYIERMAERVFPNGAEDAWCVDAALRYEGPPATIFSGAEHLAGMEVTGLRDGAIIPLFTMPTNGFFTLSQPGSKVIVGLKFSPELQTLALDLGEPTVQGKRKKVTGVTLRCQDTLGLNIGRSASSVVPMKDLQVGSLGSMTNEVVTDLVTGDARTNIDPLWDVPGQYYISQSIPYPATILGVIPEINVGDSPK